MLSVAKMAGAKYYVKQERESYYLKSRSIRSEWWGRGTEPLKLVGRVVGKVFEELRQGFASGKVRKLVQNAGRERHCGWDLVLSAPKSVSILWALLRNPAARAAIERAVLEAVKDALRKIEAECVFPRRGKGGVVVERAAGLLAALWLHTTSRNLDMQLHVHASIVPQVLRRDGTWGTMLGITAKTQAEDWVKSRSPLFTIKKTAGAEFRRSLARRLEGLGLTLEHGPEDTFEVAGIGQPLIETFSGRRAEIVREMEKRGVSGAREAAAVAVATRRPKTELDAEALFERWRKQAGDLDASTLLVLKSATRSHAAALPSARYGALESLRASAGASSPLPHREELELPARPQSASADGDRLRERVQREGGTRRSSRDEADQERATDTVLRIVRRSRSSTRHVLTRANVWLAEKQVRIARHSSFTPSQRGALARVTRGRGAVQLIRLGEEDHGVLAAARLAWQRQGFKVLLATTSRANAMSIEADTGIHSITTAGLRKGLTTNRGLVRGYESALKKATSLKLGFKTSAQFLNYALKASGRWVRFDKHTVLLITLPTGESLHDLADVLARAHRAGAKVVFVDRSREPDRQYDAWNEPQVILRRALRQDSAEEKRRNAR